MSREWLAAAIMLNFDLFVIKEKPGLPTRGFDDYPTVPDNHPSLWHRSPLLIAIRSDGSVPRLSSLLRGRSRYSPRDVAGRQ